MDPHHHDIVRLAWSRHLGLDDLVLRAGHRHIQVDPSATAMTFLRLGDSSVLVGPEQAVATAAGRSDDELARPGGLCPRSWPTVLAYAADIGGAIDRHDPLISHDLGHVLTLQESCSSDEQRVADLTHKRSWFTVLDDTTNTPCATAAYLEWEGLLADIGVLTAPDARRLGNAQVVARLATNDAIDDGLIPQWRVASDNTVARRLAARLGYEEWGVLVAGSVT